MTAWRLLAPAKINLGLFVGPVRPDGRHELVSVMQSISLADVLTLEPAPAGSGKDAPGRDADAMPSEPSDPNRDEIVCPEAPALERNNLASKALTAFRSATGWDPGPLRLTLRKRVPIAAGMGGGSGDAAGALRLAAAASGLEDDALLHEIARGLGADVPAQVRPGRWLALGAGERLRALPPPVQAFGVAVLPLREELSTAAVYAEADRLGVCRGEADLGGLAGDLQAALRGGEQLPDAGLLANDLQLPAVSLCPSIEPALAAMRGAGADLALLSGSGPTVLGLFAGEDGPSRATEAVTALAERHPRAVAAVPVGGDFARARPVRNNEEIDLQA